MENFPSTHTEQCRNCQIKEGEWRAMVKFNNRMLKVIPGVRGSRSSLSALGVRKEVKRYVNIMERSLSWQWEHVRSRGTVLQ